MTGKNLMQTAEERTLDGVRSMIDRNRAAGRHVYEGLTTAEIALYNRALMFGEDGAGFDADEFAEVTR